MSASFAVQVSGREPPAPQDVPEPEPQDPSRRRFLAGAAAVAVGTVVGVGPASAQERRRTPDQHEDDPGLLIDLTRCVGCAKCVAACKEDNALPWREDQPTRGPDADLASSNWSVVRTSDVRVGGVPRYVKMQCMHCVDPACASACFVKALQKSPEGPVVYDGDRCVGCRYCLMACPFGVPAFEWDETFGRIQKCDLCASRTSQGMPTACAEACPTGAVTFGTRGTLLSEARRRMAAHPNKYVDHIYGEHEVGGTSVLYISDVSFEELGFRTGLPDVAIPEYTWEISRLIPMVAAGLATTLVVLWHRRQGVLRAREEAEVATEVAP
jgi:formate dehydrogenase iron-sulfur subunit